MQSLQNQDEFAIKYVVLTQEIISDKNLSLAERLVLARMSGFSQFFESCEKTAETLGISAITVKRAKAKLVKLGYIEEAGDTGHGKVYHLCPSGVSFMSDRSIKYVRQKYHLCPHSNKDRINIDIKNSDSDEPKDDESSDKKVYGSKHINALMELWEAETGIVANRAQQNRYACNNLIKSRGYEGAEAIVRMVGRSIRSGDQYAPRIGSFRDLVGKYEKLSSLEAWNIRQKPAKKSLPPAMATEKPDYYFDHEETESEREETSKAIAEARKRLGFTKGANNG